MRTLEDQHPQQTPGVGDDGGWPAADHYPPYAVTADERRRWDVCIHIARTISETCEPTGIADERFVFYTSRWLYSSPLPLDEAERDVRLATAGD